jgi:hypothetical protein
MLTRGPGKSWAACAGTASRTGGRRFACWAGWGSPSWGPGLLLGCGGAALLGPVPLPGGLAGPALLFLLPALALNGGVAWAARRDLAGMRSGLRDPAGRRETQTAQWLGDVVLIVLDTLKCRL